jgi:hypothetical protein
MKELEQTPKDTYELVNTINQNQEKKRVHIGSIRPHKGHTLFEINYKTGEIKKAEFKKQVLNIGEAIHKGVDFVSKKKEIEIKENCVYISALNKENAIKKFNSR